MSNKEKIECLERRMAFLKDRIANYRADGNPSRDKAELSALQWATDLMKDASAWSFPNRVK